MKESLGHYEIVAELGRGGMGVVYKGYEPALTRYVAIKELSPALAHDHNLVERFLREARSMAALNDPHIIQVYFIGQENNQPFFAMEFVEGESLSQLIKREGRLPIADVLKILLQTARGLQTAHERGVVHRDIKPANLMLDLRGRVKIADFGIALARQEFDAKLTGTGEFVGTPGYLSPEICLGKSVDARSDLFALGIVMFESLTGRLPFSDESPLKLMLDVVQAEIPDIRDINKEVDAGTAAILTKLVAKDPADRYQSAADLIDDLELHPLVAGKGTQLGLQVRKPSGAASTLYSAPPTTPTAKRRPTPPPVVGSSPSNAVGPSEPPTIPGGSPPPAPAPAPASVRGGAPSKAPMVVAGVLLFGVLGAAAFGAYRYFGTPADTSEGAVAATEGAPTTEAGLVPPPVDGSAIAANGEGNAPTPDASTPTADGEAGADSALATGVAAGVAGTAAATANDAAAAATTPPPTDTVAPPVDSVAAAASAGPAPVAERRDARQEAREDRRAAARAATTVAVVGNGDPAIIIPVVQAIEDRASSAGWQLTENPDGADRIIRVSFDQTGTQQLQYYGRSSEMVIGQLSVRAFGPAGRALGAGFRSRIEYTALNADAKADEAIRGRLDGVVGAPDGR
ncbi:serine/threonine-protein kinase [Silanimonas sp.]|uniref:serine/threonine-protein kinase n=1 Tax=Silanimonas sp. TaxID=1929290 RepID=UPI0022C40BE0|nr:serine/threonine-protein kinase [Silanimonas sp.]MCZ8115763.1 protein kinase [Silanimonas sp.]